MCQSCDIMWHPPLLQYVHTPLSTMVHAVEKQEAGAQELVARFLRSVVRVFTLCSLDPCSTQPVTNPRKKWAYWLLHYKGSSSGTLCKEASRGGLANAQYICDEVLPINYSPIMTFPPNLYGTYIQYVRMDASQSIIKRLLNCYRAREPPMLAR